MFSWVEFLNERGIDYRDSGPNVSRGNVVTRCPFCGDADVGEHLSIAVDGAGWRCFRRPMEHRGRSPISLIAALIRCTREEAARIAGVRDLPANLSERVRAKLSATRTTAGNDSKPKRTLSLPTEFQKFSKRITLMPYLSYLCSRLEVSEDEALTLAQQLDLRCYNGRIIFPITRSGVLMSWTGRAISKRAGIRYKTLTTDEDASREHNEPAALAPTSDLLLFYDELGNSARTLYITEGPFDALKVRVLGRGDLDATCLFGLNLSPVQVDMLASVVSRYEHRYLLLDRGAFAPALRMRSVLSSLGVRLRHVPDGVKDPGALSWEHVPFLVG